MTKINPISIIVLVFSLSNAYSAETIVSKRIAATLHMTPLKKLTVGPDDQYHGTIDSKGETLIFTRKSDLVPHICSQNRNTGEVTELLPLTADSQEPSLNSDGILAFTYFKFKATGDICYRSIQGSQDQNEKITCLKAEEGEPSNPFWKNTNELGYLLRNTWTQVNKVVVENLQTGKKQVLAEGKVWSPAMSPDGKYLIYNELVSEKNLVDRALVLKNLETSKIQMIRFSLPGISGFPAFSNDGKYLYFSHYLNDTNHDNVIDGKDNSVIFRVPVEKLLKENEVFPEQLTSVESNCSFPRPYEDKIIVTCAFEGALDVYEIPASGIVPSHWTEVILKNAHQTSRTYADRILILNTLKYRFPNLPKKNLEERILSNHLLADDLQAAKYSIQKLQEMETAGQKEFYQLLNLYLEARERKKVQKVDYVTSAFENDIRQIEAKVDGFRSHPRFKKIIQGLLKSFLNQVAGSYLDLKQVQFQSLGQPVERYLYFELANWVVPKVQPTDALNGIYREMMAAPELTEESQIYYGFRFLQHLQQVKHTISERMNLIHQVNHGLPDAVSSLLLSETATLKLIETTTDPAKTEVYRELDNLMSSTRNNYFLRKALYIRSILNFEQAAEFKYLNYVATNWLRYTQNNDTEFLYARTVYSNSALDQAYDNIGKNKIELASNYFYGALSLTDDLESHYGYIQAMVKRGQRTTVNDRYDNLKNRQFIDDNMKFVDALLILIDARPEKREDVKHLDLALDKLKAMSESRDSAVRYLLLGYCYLEKLFRLSAGYEFDHDLFENTHRNLMLAYDQGRGNPRIESSALMNLGLLHQRVGNHGLATKFFVKRKNLGFTSEEENARFTWLYSRSLFFNYQADKASHEIGKILGETGKDPQQSALKEIPQNYRTPLYERRAFYLLLSNQFEDAVQAYEKLIQNGQIGKSQLNLAKVYLSYGYGLFKLGKIDQSQKALKQSLNYTSQLQLIPKSGDRLVSFDPRRLELVAYGLLGQMGKPMDRISALEKRGVLLEQMKGIFNADEWLPNQIKNQIQIAQLYNSIDVSQSVSHMKNALNLAEKFGSANQYLAHAVYRTAVDYLVHGVTYSDYYQRESAEKIQKLIEKTLHVYDQQTFGQQLLDYQRLMLQILWSAYSQRVLKVDPSSEMKKVFESNSYTRLKESLPDRWKEVNSLAAKLDLKKE